MDYDKYLVSLTRYRFMSITPYEKYKNNTTRRTEERHILANLEKGILVTSERYKKDVLSSKMYFEVSTRVGNNTIGGKSADAFLELLMYDNVQCYNLDGKEVGRLFCYDVMKNGLEQILKKLNNPYLYLNNPWQFFNYENLNLLEKQSSEKNKGKKLITLAKIKKFVPEARKMIGHEI